MSWIYQHVRNETAMDKHVYFSLVLFIALVVLFDECIVFCLFFFKFVCIEIEQKWTAVVYGDFVAVLQR